MEKDRPDFKGKFVVGTKAGGQSSKPKVTLNYSKYTSWGNELVETAYLRFNQAAKEEFFSKNDKGAEISYNKKDRVLRIKKLASAYDGYTITKGENCYPKKSGCEIRIPKSLLVVFPEIAKNREHAEYLWHDRDEIYIGVNASLGEV